MRWSCGFFSLPRQYAAAVRISLNAGMKRVVGTCGPRHRSLQTTSPVWACRLSYAVSSPEASTSMTSPSEVTLSAAAPPDTVPAPLRSISSSLYGSSASSLRASSTESYRRRENRCPDLMIFFIADSSLPRSSGVKGSATSKS